MASPPLLIRSAIGRYSAVALVFLVCAFVMVSVLSHRFKTPEPLLNFSLTTHKKKSIHTADLPKAPTLIFFGFTRCPSVCPVTLATLSRTLAEFASERLPNALFITLDPDTDSPAVIDAYLQSFHPRILGLTGNQVDLRAIYDSFKIYKGSVTQRSSDEVSLNHSAWIYLFDGRGRFVRHFSNTVASDYLAAAVRAASY